jgi:hypothetical protein
LQDNPENSDPNIMIMKTLNILLIYDEDETPVVNQLVNIWAQTDGSSETIYLDDFTPKFCWIDKNAYNVSIYRTEVYNVKFHGKIFLNHIPNQNLDLDMQIYNCVLDLNRNLQIKHRLSIFTADITSEEDILQTLEKIQSYVLDYSNLQAKLKIEDEMIQPDLMYESIIDQKFHPLIPPRNKKNRARSTSFYREPKGCQCQIV